MPDASRPPDPSAGTDPEDTDPEDDVPEREARRVALDEDSPANGLAELVLTLIKLLHDLLEKQAIRRMESGRLDEEEVEQVGRTLKRQAEELEHLCEVFNLDPDDLRLDLGTVRGVRDLDADG
jgi:hypothetical protein